MRGSLILAVMAFVALSCNKEESPHPSRPSSIDYQYGADLKHEMIVLGKRLENPYTTENMTRALESLYPTKADRVDLKTTDLYVRFLPADEHEYDILMEMDVELVDHPMDYVIAVEGDWYHDPEVPEGKMAVRGCVS